MAVSDSFWSKNYGAWCAPEVQGGRSQNKEKERKTIVFSSTVGHGPVWGFRVL